MSRPARGRVVHSVRLWAWTVDLWPECLVLGRVGGPARWSKRASVCWRPHTWREIVWVHRKAERAMTEGISSQEDTP